MAAKPTSDRLARYREKRDFEVTPEPSGASAPPRSDGHRFVVQRHRARQLHYDVRLEVDGVLASWAVPKGPTLDPEARRMAVHVEDHPLDYFDFEGVIPAGEYGGGDVIVWDWGTWSLARGDSLSDAIGAGDVHVDLDGTKLRGRFVFVRRDRDASGGKEQWLLLHKRDQWAVAGWDPEAHPLSVKSGRTNDEVRAAPSASWNSSTSWAAPSADEIAALDALGKSGQWRLGEHTLSLTNLDKVLIPAATNRAPADVRGPSRDVTKRDVVRYYASMAPVMLPYLVERAANLYRFPDGIGKPGSWQKAVPKHAPEWLLRWRDPDAKATGRHEHLVIDSPAALAWVANYSAVEIHPWHSTIRHPHGPTWAVVDIAPGTRSTFDDVVTLTRLYRDALDHLGLRGCPSMTGTTGIQIWIPVATGTTFDETRTFVETLSRAIGDALPELVSSEWSAGSDAVDQRPARVRLDHTRNAVDETLVVPFGVRAAPGAPVSVPFAWAELDDDELRPDRWTIRTATERVSRCGDPLAPLIGLQQRLPRLA